MCVCVCVGVHVYVCVCGCVGIYMIRDVCACECVFTYNYYFKFTQSIHVFARTNFDCTMLVHLIWPLSVRNVVVTIMLLLSSTTSHTEQCCISFKLFLSKFIDTTKVHWTCYLLSLFERCIRNECDSY